MDVLSKSKNLITVKCALCGSDRKKHLMEAKISPFGVLSDVVRCRDCGMIYFASRYSKEDELEFYRDSYISNYGVQFWYDSRINFFRWVLNKLEQISSDKSKLIDVGCGPGFFLKEARARGWWQVWGTDISHEGVEYGRQKLGLQIYEGDLKTLELPDGSFDVVTSWNVIDQVQNPYETLREMNRILKPGGILSLRVSNYMYHAFMNRISRLVSNVPLLSDLMDQKGCFHIHIFSRSSMKTALERTGFSQIKLLNSPIEGGGTRKTFASRVGLGFAYFFVEIIRYLSLGHIIIGPSLVVFARKPG